MAPLGKAFLAASLLAVTRAEEDKDPLDGVSLLQALSVKGVARADKKSVGALLETAGNLLKNGATEDVVEFARATLEEISGVVVPAIRDASEADQRLINQMYALFGTALDALHEDQQRVNQLHQERLSLSTQHKTCRDEEAIKCTDKQNCDYHLWDLWKIFVDEERDLRVIEGSIDGHFCVQDENGWYIANGTTFHFRDQSVPYMTSFISQKVKVDQAEINYDDYVPECERKWRILDDKTDVCDALQLNLERAACAHAIAVRDAQNAFAQAWNFALFSYNTTVHEVKLLEIDRISEYRTLSVVQCLLDRTRERNGRPCEESTDEITVEVTHCEQVRVDTDITWLLLTYPVVVPHPPLPELPAVPCNAQYINEEYGSLPAVPMPEFHEENSHCNPRPDCEGCTGIGDEPVVHTCISYWSLDHYELCSDDDWHSGTQAPPAVCPADWRQRGEIGADIGGCGLQSCGERYDIFSEDACAARCDEHSACQGFSFAPMNGDRNHPGVTACTIYNSDVPTGHWTGTEGIATQVFCGRAPALDCGELPQLTNAVWVSALNGANQYQCEEGFSFDGTASCTLILEVECFANGFYSDVHTCLPINDCTGHTCGAFGTCRDLHMDYTCDCVDGYEMTTTEDGEKICGNIDDCAGHLCGEAGVCRDLVSDYECDCQDGWEQVVLEISDVKTCERIECGDAPQIPHTMSTTSDVFATTSNGIFSWTRGKAVFEEMVDYTCAPGYTTNGQTGGSRTFSIMCQADGTYTEAAECIPISCGSAPQEGQATPIHSDPVTFPGTVEYSCPTGHEPAIFSRSCMETGQFSPTLPCEPTSCGPAPSLPHAAPPQDGLFFYGQVHEYRCLPGYTTSLGGTSEATFEMGCMEYGWDLAHPGCVPVACDFTPDETHFQEELTWFYPVEYPVTCAAGYTVDGTADGDFRVYAMCNADGTVTVNSCLIVTCSGANLEEAMNANVVREDHPLGSTATYTCHEGHAVANTNAATFEVECLRTGHFSSLSTCRNIDDCEGHSCGSNGFCVDGINDYTCNCEEGFEEVISDSGEKVCGNIDDCGPQACGPHGACHDLVNGYSCECDHGYVLEQQGEEQVCVPVQCPAQTLDNADDVPAMHFPHTLFVECYHGHDLGGVSGEKARSYFMVECSADGVLTSEGSTTLPQCRPTVCGMPPDVGGTLTEVREYSYTEIANTQCPGVDMTVSHECRADGQFYPYGPYTTCRNPCTHQPVQGSFPAHGEFPTTSPDSVTWMCGGGSTPAADGRPLLDGWTQACLANGEYAPANLGFDLLDHCRPVVCERPAAPPNWRWVSDQTFDTFLGAALVCNDGFESSECGSDGYFWVTCQENGAAGHLPNPCVESAFQITGRVKNAVNPTQSVGNAVIVFSDGQQVTSGGDGRFTVRLPAGQFTYTVVADGYIPIERGSVTVTGHGNHDIIMSPILAANSFRIVLEWSDSPRDLDSHLVFKGHEWSCPEIYYANPRASCNGVSVNLDWDEMWGHGPETVTIEGIDACREGWITTCRWVYKVKNWTAFSWREDVGWVRSEAHVRVFNGNIELGHFFVNQGHGYQMTDGRYNSNNAETDYYWHVFALNGLGEVNACTNQNCD